jgi:DNA processing protein
LSRELVEAGFVVVSGLALGVDTAAHAAAIEAGGSTIGVIGTPLDRAYPAENAGLQEDIYRHHLLISPFARGERTFKSSFPKRNRVMAAVTDATVIMEASDTSGSLHQAAECVRLGRWLFIAKSVVDNPDVTWPAKFLRAGGKTAILTATGDLVREVLRERP